MVGRQEEGETKGSMVLCTKVVVPASTITTTTIITTERVDLKKFANILSLRRAKPFQW